VVVRLFNPTVEEHGWQSPHTVLQAINDDMPFLVDSIGMALAQEGITIHVLGHPVVNIERDADGRMIAAGQGVPESLMFLEIDRQTPGEDFARIEANVRKAMGDVRVIVGDWARMRDRMNTIAEELARRPMPVSRPAREEAQEFLRWAANNHFTFFGYREYEVVAEDGIDVLRAVPGTGLGLLRGTDKHPPRPLGQLAAHSMQQSGATDGLILTKTNARSTVHRSGFMDYIGVLSFDENDRAVREERFLGLYTSSAYAYRPWDIPLVRQRYDHVMARSGLAPNSHSGKALKNILEMLPRDELFQSSEDELYRTATGILGLQERVRPKLFLRRDPYGRFFSALAFVPRDRFNTDTRLRIERMLKDALKAEQIDTSIQVGESPLAQLHLIARPKPGASVEFDAKALDAELGDIVRNWHDELRDQVVAKHGEQDGLRMANRYGRALPMAYIEEVTPAIAANDVEHLAALAGPDDLGLSLCRAAHNNDGQGALRFKLYRQNSDIPLSDVLPVMENLGLRVISEHPYRLEIEDQPVYIQDFEVEAAESGLDVDALDECFEEAFARIWRGDAENDGFNRLILAGGLGWRQVAMLRGYNKYLQQVGVPFSQPYVEQTLAKHPLLARLLVELFEAKFDPATGSETPEQIEQGAQHLHQRLLSLAGDEPAQKILQPVLDARSGSREQQIDSTRNALKGLLDRVSILDEDRILRSYISVIDATLRTNYYQLHDGKPAHYIACKFDSTKVPDLPKPVPYREIFMYSPRVEGIHLRFGPVARGGLRWSDRREDFRTEVLGLVKAQMVKNTVIVPVGAKGGFFVKKSPVGGDRDAVLAEGVACYKMFINALLDITDNIVDGKIIAPQGVVRHDGDDPYLVVAADKGTATFSDIANGIAAEHDFWLGDAFASGGSVGYDHKGMGITARGAWESVKRHFRAMDRDCQQQDFTCVGIGDMSGDVFGNGMLLSRHIRLLAAFDHRHIFLDPDPDAAITFKERQRMFTLPRSSWEDYDKTLIGKGGGVFPRSAKSIALSPEIKAALGIDAEVAALSPPELMHAILKAPVDLLWNGGIGTYVKGSAESHADVGDRANNALRVDGRELRCKVVGEGGNLGLTQRGRIEAALSAGVLLNTDFIDNSAGVDTSD
ncbi:MAG: NAD-glutamate dehydrogenase, partial [Pseudomonadota bacterium]|nr:NAD-glutamate dehydrogenase [Pseudomonadota bacterium]